MDDLRDIEAGLERLMPRGLSEEASERFEGVIDELAENSAPGNLFPWWQTMAATIVVGAGVFAVNPFPKPGGTMAAVGGPASEMLGQPVEVLEQTVWLENGGDDGIKEMGDSGETRRAWWFTGVEEEKVRHAETGYEVTLQREVNGEVYLMTSL